MVGWSGQPINGYAPNKFLLGCITAFLLCWRTVDSSDWNDAPEGLASGSHSHRQLSKVRCRTVVLELDVPTIKVTDEVWQEASANLQALVSCLPDEKGGVLEFNTTGKLIPSEPIFFEHGPVTITSVAGRMSGGQAGDELVNKVVFSCPESLKTSAFMEISGGKVVLDNIVIDGCEPSGEHPVIGVDKNTDLVIRNSVIKNVNRNPLPGSPAIFVDSGANLEIDNSIFKGVKGIGVLGIVEKASAVVKNSKFINNSVLGNGGVIRADSGRSLQVRKSKFINNSATLGGGAIYAKDTVMEVEKCEFTGNQGKNGGAISFKAGLESGNITLKVASSIFTENIGESSGGSLHMSGIIRAELLAVEIEGSTATSGGAVWVNGTGSVKFEDTQLVQNTASKIGGGATFNSDEEPLMVFLISTLLGKNGAVKGGGLILSKNVDLEILGGVHCSANTAQERGGAMSVGEGSSISGTGAVFLENEAGTGGAIYIESGKSGSNVPVSLEESEFSLNSAKDVGGGIAMEGVNTTCKIGPNVNFTENTAASGGGIAVLDGSNLQVFDSRFVQNTVNELGGALWTQGLVNDVVLEVFESRFTENESQRGGAVFVEGPKTTATFNDIHFLKNNALNSGGGLVIMDGPSVALTKLSLVGNTAKINGGGILVEAISNPTLVEVLESTFSKNIAKNGGGMYSSAVSRDQKLVDIKLSVEVNFSSNVAFEHGGGIAMKNQGTLSLSGGVFLDNNATISGGGAYIQAGKETIIQIEDSRFIRNSASMGGAMEISGGAQCQLVHSVEYTQNTANQGGALHMFGEDTTLDAESTKFIENQAANGGAIYAYGASVLKLTRANFERNTANLSQKTSKKLGLSGGAIFATGSVKIQLDSSEFSENVAESIGGAMAILVNATDKNAPGIALKDVEFRGNLAEDLGGAVAIQGEDSSDLNLKILRSMFLKNSADQGGAVWIDKGVNSVRIEGTTIKENTASTQAGGMGIRNVPQCLLTGVTATDNRAGIYGGALSFECDFREKDCEATISSTEFTGNEVKDSGIMNEGSCSGITVGSIPDSDPPGGGGISASGDSLTLKINLGSTFKGNTAMEGGAIHCVHARKVSILDSTLEGNKAVHGGAVSAHGPTNRIRMTSSTMSRNEACIGGALYLREIVPNKTLDPPVWIQNMIFEENMARIAGGAVFTDDVGNAGVCCSCESETSGSILQPLNESVVSYIQSECGESWRGNQINGAGYGGIFASQPVELRVAPKFVKDHLSGTFMPRVNISYVDIYGQPVPAPGVLVKVSGDQATLRGQTISDMFTGATTFDGTIVQASPGTYNLTYTFSSWDERTEIAPVQVMIHISTCQFGEFTGNDGTSCQLCPTGNFNFGESVTDCSECPNHAVCNGTLLVPDQGYWHSTVYSTQMHKCLGWKACSWEGREQELLERSAMVVANSASVVGRKILETSVESEYLLSQCKQGYDGPVCGSCSDDYARIRSNRCVKCGKPIGYLLAAVLLVLWFILLVGTLTHHGWNLGVVTVHKWYDSDSDTDGINPHPEPYESAGNLKLKRLPRTSARSEVLMEKKNEPSTSCEKEILYPNPSPGPSLSSLSNCSRCEIETDVGSSTNPPEALSRVSSLNPHSDLKQIKISMDGEVKPQVSMTRSHCEGKTSEIDLPQIPKGERTNSENQREGQRRGLPFEVVKILVNFMQVTSLAAFIHTGWIGAIMKTFQIQDFVGAGGDSILPFSCASASSTPLERIAIKAVYPVVLAAAAVGFWLLVRCFCQHTLSALWDRWILSIVAILYIGYTNVTRRSLEFLNCVNIDDKDEVADYLTPASFWAEGKHWAQDTTVKCFEGTHNQLTRALALPLLIFVTAGLPLTIMVVLLFNRKKLQDLRLLRKYGFIYQCYRSECGLWEVIIFIRKASLACLMAFTYSLEPELQSVLAMAVLMVSLFVHLWVWPYRENCRSFNRMEALSLFTSSMAFYNVLLIENGNVDKLVGDVFSIVVVVCIVLVTLYMLSELQRELATGLDWELARQGIQPGSSLSTLNKVILLYKMRMNAFTHSSRSSLRSIVKCFPGCGCC